MIRRPPRSTLSSSSAASDVYKRQVLALAISGAGPLIRLNVVRSAVRRERRQFQRQEGIAGEAASAFHVGHSAHHVSAGRNHRFTVKHNWAAERTMEGVADLVSLGIEWIIESHRELRSSRYGNLLRRNWWLRRRWRRLLYRGGRSWSVIGLEVASSRVQRFVFGRVAIAGAVRFRHIRLAALCRRPRRHSR